MAGLAAFAGLASFAIVGSASSVITAHLDPTYGTLVRNRRIAGGLATLGGIALAFVDPLLGAGVATGGLAVLAGSEASMALISVLPAPSVAPGSSAAPMNAQFETAPRMSSILGPGQRQQFGAIVQGGRQRLGAVVQGGRQRLGALQGSSVFG